ncbi:diacylglycerol kinase family protein [Chelativorans sp. M5D2P16]|uniref:diacylglycerol/lipid kinase family protein n=1 Tax=Chelativorans sp. M5D2P16 TaxID=3095678 RepID=UPI002ACA1536|nr:diacylglycerol kinase family protein [Chelativorans sp. M5D2P16]MDZ5699136.1 diacylglycerol kinase family protein [Chelativorans sp. M5D2P16]
MHIRAVLNRDGGTFSTMNLDRFTEEIVQAFTETGHCVAARQVDGHEIEEALRAACRDDGVDAVLVGGGDGTISLAAGLVAESGKILAVLPAGTMNLFARSIAIPLDLEAAVTALAKGHVREVDIARLNGRPFVHQFSIGMHPQLIRLRTQMPFRGRLGKIAASARAAITTLLNPQNLRVSLTMGESELLAETASISVTNNLYGEGHLPYTDSPDGGVLGIYITRARRRSDLIVHFLNMAIGRWRQNEQVEIHEAGEVRLRVLAPRRELKCSIDGELCPLDRDIHIRQHPRALRVLVPTESQES